MTPTPDRRPAARPDAPTRAARPGRLPLPVRPCALAALLALSSACASPARPALEPLAIVHAPDFEFRAGLGSPEVAWASLSADLDPAARAGHAALIAGVQQGEASPPAPLTVENGVLRDAFALEVVVLPLDLEEAEQRLGWRGDGPWAAVVDQAVLAERLEELRTRIPIRADDGQQLTLGPDSPAQVTLLQQTAFVREFALQRFGTALIADPSVDVLAEGLSLHLQAAPGETPDSVQLTVDLAQGECQTPTEPAAFRLALGSDLQLQQPLVLAQNLRTTALLGPGEALLLVTLGSESSSELVFTILQARPYAPGVGPVQD